MSSGDRIVVAFGAPALAATGAVLEQPAAPVAAAEIPAPAPALAAAPAPVPAPAPVAAPAPAPVPAPAPAPAPRCGARTGTGPCRSRSGSSRRPGHCSRGAGFRSVRVHRASSLAGLQGCGGQRHPAPDLRGLRAELRLRARGEGDGVDQACRRAVGPGARSHPQDQRAAAGAGPRVGEHHPDHDIRQDPGRGAAPPQDRRGQAKDRRRAAGARADVHEDLRDLVHRAANMAGFRRQARKIQVGPGHDPVRRAHQEHHRLGHGARNSPRSSR